MQRARVFIDYWDFQLTWNGVTGKKPCDWKAVPKVLVERAREVLGTAGVADDLSLQETTVYTSVLEGEDEKQRRWLDWLDRQASYRIERRERQLHPRPVHCRLCKVLTHDCPNCGERYMGAPEKGVDAAIVSDLVGLAWDGEYDVAVLAASDADFVPVVERLQRKGFKIVNAGWRGKGHKLKAAAWAHFDIDEMEDELCR